MPSHTTHNYADRKFFGKSYWKIHLKMDSAYKLLGSQHRILYHDFLTAALIGQTYYPNDPNAAYSALLHIFLDQACTQNPTFKADLELLARLDSQRAPSKKKIEKRKRKTKRRSRKTLAKPKTKKQKDSSETNKSFAKFLKLMKSL